MKIKFAPNVQYKMGNFYKKSLKKKLFPLGENRENTLNWAPKAMIAFGAFLFCSRHQRVRKNLIFIHPQDEGPRGTTFK